MVLLEELNNWTFVTIFTCELRR